MATSVVPELPISGGTRRIIQVAGQRAQIGGNWRSGAQRAGQPAGFRWSGAPELDLDLTLSGQWVTGKRLENLTPRSVLAPT